MSLKILDDQEKPVTPAPRGLFASLMSPPNETQTRGFVALPDPPTTEMLLKVAEFLNTDLATTRTAYCLFLRHAPTLGSRPRT